MLQASAPPGTVWLPDEEGRLAPAASMHYNDAPWLLDSALRLVNTGIPNPLADQLGVQSLRFHHQVRVSFSHAPTPEVCTAPQLQLPALPLPCPVASVVSLAPAGWPSHPLYRRAFPCSIWFTMLLRTSDAVSAHIISFMITR